MTLSSGDKPNQELVDGVLAREPYDYEYTAQNREVEIERARKYARLIALETLSALARSHELPQELIEGVHFVKDGDRYIATHPDMPAPPSSTVTPSVPLEGAPRELWLAKGRLSGQWEHHAFREPTVDGWQRYVREDLAVPSAIGPTGPGGWIDVKDALPGQGKDVTVTDGVAIWKSRIGSSGGWSAYESGCGEPVRWMPLNPADGRDKTP